MKELFWMGDDCRSHDSDGRHIPSDASQWACVRAENDAEAVEKARQLGLADDYNAVFCRAPRDIPEAYIGRLLSAADLDELARLRSAHANMSVA